jgi:hypothetical protein
LRTDFKAPRRIAAGLLPPGPPVKAVKPQPVFVRFVKNLTSNFYPFVSTFSDRVMYNENCKNHHGAEAGEVS